MKSRKSNNIRILQQEAPIPEIVEQRMEDAFLAIQNGEAKCGTEPVYAPVHKRYIRRWSFAAAAVFAVCVVTACAAAYTNWSRSLEGRLQITEGQKQLLEENHAWSVLDQPVTSEGVTVTAGQCIADSYCAYITFKIEGYELPEGASPGMKRLQVAVGDYDSRDVYYYADFYRNAAYDKEDDGISEIGQDGSFVMDDGSLEYQLRILTMEKGALLGRPIQITLQGLGSRTEEAGTVYDNPGIWEFSWTLHGTAHTAETVLYERLGGTGVTIIKAEVSPISIRFTFDRGRSGMWPRLFGFRTKDGKMHLNTAGAGISRFDDFSYVRCTILNASTRIMDAEQIDALVFTDMNYKFKKDDSDMHFYTVPIRGFDPD